MQIRLDPTTEQFLVQLTDTTKRMNKAQQEISSGKRFTSVSDDPDRVSALLQSRLELSGIQQIKENLARVRTEVDTAEQSLGYAVTLLEGARVTAAQAASTFTTAEQKLVLSQQVATVLERLVATANMTVEGRYIFSGDADATAAYVLDLSDPSVTAPYGTYQGGAATRRVLAPDGSTFAGAHSGEQIFGNAAAGKNVLAAVDTLRRALLTNDDALLSTAMADISTSQEHLRSEHASYGALQARVRESGDTAAKQELRYRTQLGEMEDADITQSVVNFQKAVFQRDAALQAHSRIPQKSLFDYLG